MGSEPALEHRLEERCHARFLHTSGKYHSPMTLLPDPMLLLAASVSNLPLLTTIAAAFAAAWVLGLLAKWLGLSPIVGYLLAGIVIGPHTPGFVGDVKLAQQLAEIGVILLMFGVGLHFHLKDLWAVRAVALPGALVQTLFATLATVALFSFFGFPLKAGFILGMAMAVASTVVLLRVLIDRRMLSSSHGHVAVGWLIVEDILTVLALIVVPLLATAPLLESVSAAPVTAAAETTEVSGPATAAWAVLKLVVFVAIVLVGGAKVIPKVLSAVAKLRSPELFTLTVLVFSIAVAVGSAALFGASLALGAFLAGMVVAQSPLSHQAAADALPMRDAFAVLFFVSVGMLLEPAFIIAQPLMVLAGLVVVLIVKPIAALAIVAVCGYPLRTGLTVAIGLAQIGEFSFILAQSALEFNLLPPAAMNVLVATAICSIAINPLLFASLDRIERGISAVGPLHRLLTARHAARSALMNAAARQALAKLDADSAEPSDAATDQSPKPLAIIVGYGPVGRLIDAMLRDGGMTTMIIEMNIETVESLIKSGRMAMYGDAQRRDVLDHAGIRSASHFIVTMPETQGAAALAEVARELNPAIKITLRARYLAQRDVLTHAQADTVIFDEGEAGIAMARHVLASRGVTEPEIAKLLNSVRTLWQIEKPQADSR